MFTAAQIAAMDDREMALHASGSYGPKLRNDFIASVRKIAGKADARESLTLLHGGRRDYAQLADLHLSEPQTVA